MILYYLLSCLLFQLAWTTVVGEVVMISSPQHPSEGDTVVLTCKYMQQARNASVVSLTGCAVKWSRSPKPRSSIPIKDSGDKFSLFYANSKNGTYIEAALEIRQIQMELEGQYTCLWSCQASTQSASFSLKLKLSEEVPNVRTVVSTALSIVIIVIILLCMTLWSARENFRRRNRNYPFTMERSNHRNDDQISNPTQAELPPKYSDVASSLSSLSLTRNDKHENATLFHSSEYSTDMDVSSLPPPNYATALMYLARSGNPFNPESVQPMPPSYSD